jgi:hypothetical protein
MSLLHDGCFHSASLNFSRGSNRIDAWLVPDDSEWAEPSNVVPLVGVYHALMSLLGMVRNNIPYQPFEIGNFDA